MKFLLYRVNTKKKKMEREFALNIERILFLSFIVTFVTMIIVQAALMSPAVRTSLAINDEFEGAPLGTEEFLYNEGKLVLQLLGGEANHNLKILINGDEAARFSDISLEIAVRNGDVVEIDGSDVHDEIEVAVVFKSDNVASDCLNKVVKVNSNVQRLLKVKVE